MKNKLVIWGTNAQNEKVLIAAELQPETNKVLIHTFPEAIASDDFVDIMMKDWRDGKAVEFPEGFSIINRDLNAAESLLPDDLKVDRTDIINRAQTEWHFAVLSSKLNEAYRTELAELREKVEAMSAYDNGMWDNLKKFWDKVQMQVRERNLWREHADDLRDGINGMFDQLKELRSKANDEFTGVSKKFFDEMSASLGAIENKIESGNARMNVIFDDLKNLQRKYREGKMTNEHRNKLWDRLDGAFKRAKEKRFGPEANEGSPADRHNRRLQGLVEAIRRMEDSIYRDEDELDYQSKRIAASEGQLEAQIRQAKIKLVEERIGSKRVKLQEMVETRAEVEKQAVQAKQREEKRVEKDEERQKFHEAREKIKSKIDAQATHLSDIHPPKKDESIIETAGTMLGEVFENALDTMKAVAKVVGDKADAAMDKAEAAIEKANEKAKEKAEKLAEDDDKPKSEQTILEKAEGLFESVSGKVESVVDAFFGDDDKKKDEEKVEKVEVAESETANEVEIVEVEESVVDANPKPTTKTKKVVAETVTSEESEDVLELPPVEKSNDGEPAK